MQCWVGTFSARSGTGTQTITGVVDADGNPFVGKLFLFQSAYAAADTVTAGPWPLNNYMDSRGADTGAVRSASVVASEDFGFKDMSGAQSDGDYSLLDFVSQPSFGGEVKRRAKITAVASGSFELTYAQNDRTGDVVHVSVFGGADLTIELPNSLGNGTKTVTGPPKGLLVYPGPGLSSAGGTATGTGGRNVAWGWATPAGVMGALCYATVNQGSQFNAQRTDAISLTISDVGVLGSDRPYVSAWTDTSVTIAGNPTGTVTGMPIVFSGSDIVTSAGRLTQPLVAGSQSFTTGLDTKWIMFVAGGYAADTAVQTPVVETVLGWAAGATQAGFWTGERQATGIGATLYGARYLATDSVLRFGNPDGSSTTFTSVASVTSIAPDGTVTLDWSSVDGTARAIDWFAIGTETATLGTIDVVKEWADTPGQTRLRIGTTAGAYDVMNLLTGPSGTYPQSTGAQSLAAGNYFISEADQYLYDVTISALKNGAPYALGTDFQVTLANGDVVVVTIQNASPQPPQRYSQWKLYRFDLKPRREESS